MNDLNAIKARLGSISPKTMASLPKAVQTLLTEDMPRLLNPPQISNIQTEISDREFETFIVALMSSDGWENIPQKGMPLKYCFAMIAGYIQWLRGGKK